ncbi:MAG: HlyD family secretion protein [Rhodospirillaceae bacterium]|nr:MAG: HlyD family secretion protein [Rhodospirillaceae bacterium]
MGKPVTRDERETIEAVLRLETGQGRRLVRRGMWWGGGVLLLLLVFYVWLERDESGTGPVYVTEPVRRGALTVTVTATGTVEPTNTVAVSSELSGVVRKVLVDYNSVVAVGDVLAELETDRLEATIASSRAKLLKAEAQLEQAKATVEETRLVLERKEALIIDRAGSQQDLDTARAAHDRARAGQAGAEADIAVAVAQLKLDETNLAKARIRSPINGLVLKRDVDPGQTVASSLQAPTLFTLAQDLEQMEIQVEVDEADVGTVREGQAAFFSVDAYPDRTFPATIRQVRFGSEVVQGVVTYKAILVTDNTGRLLRPGMTATAAITVEHFDEVLTVPNAALRFALPAPDNMETRKNFLRQLLPGPPRFRQASPRTTAETRHTVWILQNGAPVAVPVVAGTTDGRWTVIPEGTLDAGQAVIVDAVSAGR